MPEALRGAARACSDEFKIHHHSRWGRRGCRCLRSSQACACEQQRGDCRKPGRPHHSSCFLLGSTLLAAGCLTVCDGMVGTERRAQQVETACANDLNSAAHPPAPLAAVLAVPLSTTLPIILASHS